MSNSQEKTDFNESRLVASLQAGEEWAYRLLVAHYKQRLFKLAYGIVQEEEEALDIVQDVFIKAFENIGRFRGQAKLSTWLHRITVNQSLNWKRRWKRRLRWHHKPLEREDGSEYPELKSERYAPDQLHNEKLLARAFENALRALPEQARAVYVLREAEGLTYDEIAQVLGIKRGTVSSRLFHARERLKTHLEQHLDLRVTTHHEK